MGSAAQVIAKHELLSQKIIFEQLG